MSVAFETPPSSHVFLTVGPKRFERRLCRRNFSWGAVRKGGEAPLRGILPQTGIDVSPIVVILAIMFLQAFLIPVLRDTALRL